MTGSLHKTAYELGFAYAKVRKALITYGAYSTRFSNEVYCLRCKGYTIEEIAKELDTTTKRVSAWLPYEKSIYNLPEKTQDAVRSSNYRKRNEQARANLVLAKHTGDGEEEGKATMKTKAISRTASACNEGNGPAMPGEPIRLHLKLHDNGWFDEDERRILVKYGQSLTGNSIERDILIPHDMTLHNLHYAILRLMAGKMDTCTLSAYRTMCMKSLRTILCVDGAVWSECYFRRYIQGKSGKHDMATTITRVAA